MGPKLIIVLVLLLTDCWYSECAYKSNFMLDDYDDYGKEFDNRFGRMSRSRSASSREDKLGEDESQEQTEQASGGKELGELMKQMPSMNAMNRRYNSHPDFQDSRYDYGYGNKGTLNHRAELFSRRKPISINSERTWSRKRQRKIHLRD